MRALEGRHVDLLISDLRMPDMSGVDVLRAGKQLDPELSAIVVTAYASTETAVEAMRLGACDYLTKPFDVDELKILVRNTLERGRLRQENVLLEAGARKGARLLEHHRAQPARCCRCSA